MNARLTTILPPDRLITGLRVRDKAHLLQEMAARSARDLARPADDIAAALQDRERLGSTGLGKGFALPHARLAALKAPYGLLFRLARPIDFTAIDGRPVDLAVLLLMPVDDGQEQIATLAAVARAMRNPDRLQALRSAAGSAELHAILAAAIA